MMRLREKDKKCICKKCENCHHWRNWDVIDKNGLHSVVKGCSIDVMADTLPKLIGSIDGCQQASNETRNSVMRFGESAIQTLKMISKQVPQLLTNSKNIRQLKK